MNWRDTLRKVQKLHSSDQHEFREEIVRAFKQLCDLIPSEKVFTRYTEGVVIYPEMLWYIMIMRRKE